LQRWAKSNEKKPCDFTKEKKQDALSQKSFVEAVENFLSLKEGKVKPSTFLEYQKKLRNQIIPLIGEATSLKELEWANGGRKLVMDAVVDIGGGSPGLGQSLALGVQHTQASFGPPGAYAPGGSSTRSCSMIPTTHSHKHWTNEGGTSFILLQR
jgi:hypothetical protein